jgi:(p)ppGpp synthase/HD superfamily hydrolase
VPGYSDRINHALAFAAKHHDQQVRKGTRAPYLIKPANVAIILARYGRDDDSLVAGVLHDVIEDFVRDGHSTRELEERFGGKFGGRPLEFVLSIVSRRFDDTGVEFSAAERTADHLHRLSAAPENARWVCAANALHNAASLATDLRRTVETDVVWSRTRSGRARTMEWYVALRERLMAAGFTAEIMDELAATIAELERYASPETPT